MVMLLRAQQSTLMALQCQPSGETQRKECMLLLRHAKHQECRILLCEGAAYLKVGQNSRSMGPAVAWTSLRLSFCKTTGNTRQAQRKQGESTALTHAGRGGRQSIHGCADMPQPPSKSCRLAGQRPGQTT
jgi:hypothetical protein